MNEQKRIAFVGIDIARVAEIGRALGDQFISEACTAEDAIDGIVMGGVDVCVANLANSASRAGEVVREARASGRVEAVVLADSVTRTQALEAVASGAFCFLLYPHDSEQIAKIVVRATEAAGRRLSAVGYSPAAIERGNGVDSYKANGFVPPAGLTLEQIERATIYEALKRTRGNKQAAANALGIYRPRLYSKIRKYNMTEFM